MNPPRQTLPPHRPLLNARFLAAAFCGSVGAALVGEFAGLPEQVAFLGVLVSGLIGLQLGRIDYAEIRDREHAALLAALQPPRGLVGDAELLAVHRGLTDSLASLSAAGDGTLRRSALLLLGELDERLRQMADGRLTFDRTETWRIVYERLLKNPEVSRYRSVAWFRADAYWQDVPGRQSLALNCELAEAGLLIHRAVIVPHDLWSDGDLLPREPVRAWVNEQHVHGIWVTLVREGDVRDEPDLPVDLGLYGDLAVGYQTVDPDGRTRRFELDYREAERARGGPVGPAGPVRRAVRRPTGSGGRRDVAFPAERTATCRSSTTSTPPGWA